MKIEVSCFTQRGQELGNKLVGALAGTEASIRQTRCGKNGLSLAEWATRCFATADALVFIGATGIAVRAIAPLIDSKISDPAVVVLDEYGYHVISLLAGHIGKANELALQIADALGAQAVITTATDLNGIFAVDVWARQHGYHIQNPSQIKDVSAKLLAGGSAMIRSQFPLRGDLPEGITAMYCEEEANASDSTKADIGITIYNKRSQLGTLWLTPPALVLGVGCQRDIPEQTLEEAYRELVLDEGLDLAAVGLVTSIDIKSEERGLLAFCKQHAWPLQTFSSDDLAQVPGVFNASSFVKETTGVDNVCERSAVLGSGGTLIVNKTSGNGVTMAVAMKDWIVDFGESI